MVTNSVDDKIWEAFERLLMDNNQQFSDIRVGQICKVADIHRSTFYRHFEDKYQLLEYGLKKLWQDYFDLSKKARVYEPFQTAESFYTKSKGKKLINKHLSDDNFIEVVDHFFLEQMKAAVLDVLPQDIDLPKELIALYTVTNIQVVEEWQKQEKLSLTAKELDDYYQQLVMKSLSFDLEQ